MENFSKKGFTLIELVAVIGIIGMVFSIMFVMFKSGLSMYSNGMKIEATETNSRLALETLTKNIKVSKVLYSTDYVTTNIDFNGFSYDDSTVQPINQSDLRAYMEDYSGNRYIYAIRNLKNGKKELHELKLTNKTNNCYSIPDTIIELSLTEADNKKLDDTDPSNLSQEVIRTDTIKYIKDYGLSSYAMSNPTPILMYDNFGADCYLVINNKDNIRKKIKLREQIFNTLTVSKDTKICENVDDIIIDFMETQGKITIKISNGDKPSSEIQTYVNILNYNKY